MAPNEFWKLAITSRLLSAEKCQHYQSAFAQAEGQRTNGDATALARWLVARKALSPYQARILLAGEPGPFVYGDYRVYDHVTTGRLAGLFRAHHVPSRRAVGLSFLSGPALADPDVIQRLRQQAASAAAIRHPHLCQVDELVECDGFKLVVIEDLRGKSAAEHVASKGAFSARDACRIAHQAALGLSPLHVAGLAHGEVQPDNLWLVPRDGVKLLRFPLHCDPLALKVAAETALVRADFLAPERFAADGSADPRGDVYSLGCTLYFLLTGRAPFAGGDLEDKQVRHAHEEFEPASQVKSEVPPAIDELLGFLTAKLLELRYPDASAAAAAIKPFAESSASNTSIAAPLPPVLEINESPSVPIRADAVDPPVVVDLTKHEVTVASRVRSRYSPRRSKPTWAFAAVSLAVLVVAAFLLYYMPKGDKGDPSTPPEPPGNTTVGRDTSGSDPVQPPPPVVADDPDFPVETIRPLGDPLWASPTAGDLLDLRYLPPGGQLFVALRPAELLAHPEGPKLLELPGPVGTLLRDTLPGWCGVALGDIEQIILSLSGDVDTLAAVVRFSPGVDPADAMARLGGAEPLEHPSGETLHRRGAWIYYIPASDGHLILAIVPDRPAEIEGLLASRELANPLRREMETLLGSSDVDRHVTILLAPSYLAASGRWLFAAEAANLRGSVSRFISDDGQAVLMSFHLDDNLFAELRVLGSADVPAGTLAQQFDARMRQLPIDVEDYVVALAPSPYSKRVLLRYPQMIHLLSRYTRVGTDDRQVVLRGTLPAVAAHNLWLGSHLAMLESPGVTAAGVAGQPVVENPSTVAERLRQTITLSFPRHALDHCLQLLAEEIGAKIEIIGRDLELEGITRNQSLGLDERDKPAVEILMIILQLANPDGKLVYVIRPPADGSEETIFITTRAAAARRGETLPEEFHGAE